MYKLFFFCLLFFILGRVSVNFKVYVGNDEAKYNAANIGVLLK